MRHKCGIYLRVSTEEQAQVVEGSISSQKHRLMSFVDIKNVQEPGWGKVIEIYADEGLSAKDTRRPAFQRMMKDIRQGKINLILVADLSRLSRNILDFCILLDELKKYSAKFLSIKEQFDTSTPVGELMVFNMISLAQFERKQTAERVSLNFHSRASRGLLNGGPVILGYDKDPTNPCSYVVNEVEAEQVRRIYQMYLEEGTIAKTLQRVNAEKIPRKLNNRKGYRLAQAGVWNFSAIQRLLSNPAYVGMREVNQRYKDHDQNELKAFQKYQIVKAAWPAIVPRELYDDVQRALAAAQAQERVRLANAEKRVFFLSGMLRCPECGAPYIGEAGHGKKEVYRYYVHKRYIEKPFSCKVRRFRADLVEDKVIEHLNTFLQQEGYLDQIDEKIRSGVGGSLGKAKDNLRRVVAEISKVESQIMSIFRLQTTMNDGPGLELVKSQLDDLATQKTKLKAQKEEIEGTLAELKEKSSLPESTRGRILSFPTLWAKGTPAEQKRLLRTIFQHLLPTEKSLQIFFWLNETDEVPGSGTNAEMKPRNEKRDVDSKSASLISLPVIPCNEIPAINLNGVTEGT